MSINYSAMAFPKDSWKQTKSKKQERQQSGREKPRAAGKKRKKHRKSIMHPKNSGYCYLCASLNNDYTYKYTEEHHVMFGKGQRQLSEEYGLTVQLCKEHHKDGSESAHSKREIRELLCRDAQAAFIEEYPELKWKEIFEKNYLEEQNETTKEIDKETKEHISEETSKSS